MRTRLFEVQYANAECKKSRSNGWQLVSAWVWARDVEVALEKLRSKVEVKHVGSVLPVETPFLIIE